MTTIIPIGMPTVSFNSKWFESIKVFVMNLNETQYSIRQALHKIEAISSVEWDFGGFYYVVEYASKPIEKTAPQEVLSIIREKKYNALMAANVAAEWFPHNLNIDFNSLEPPSLIMTRKWCKSVIQFKFNLSFKCFEICFEHIDGDIMSHKYIKSTIEDHFTKIRIRQINLLDALFDADACDNVDEYISEYLVRDLL